MCFHTEQTKLPKETSEIKNTYAIFTTEASLLLVETNNHKKKILVVLKREDESKWFQHESINQFAFPYSIDLVATKTDSVIVTLW